MNINLVHKTSNAMENTPTGFSVTCLFLGPIVPLVRGDAGSAVKMILLCIVTFGIYGIVFASTYNKTYIKQKVMQGFVPADDQATMYMQMNGLYMAPQQPQQQVYQQQQQPVAQHPPHQG